MATRFFGKHDEAPAVLKELAGRYEKQQAIGRDLAAVYAGLGEKDQAVAWLEKDFQGRSGSVGLEQMDTAFRVPPQRPSI
jgi:hypothetical protein